MWRPLLYLTSMFFASACGGGGSKGPTETGDGYERPIEPPAGGVAAFTAAPIDLSRIPIITALGTLGPPGHVLPTDHAYLYQVDFDARPIIPSTLVLPVYAPARGAVNFIYHQTQGTDDYKVGFIVTKDFSYYLDHVRLLPNIKKGLVVEAGEQVGNTNPGGSLDLGAFDLRVTLPGLVNPLRYGDQTLHCVSPWAYFTEPLKSTIYAKVRRHPTAQDKDGHIDFGIAGRLSGDWYEQSVPSNISASGPDGWPKSISFAYDYYDPRLIRVSIGGTVAPRGIWTLPLDATAPSHVSVASGKVSYRLLYTESTYVQYGLMIVQMLADDRIKIEVFPGSQAATADFDEGAFTYLR